MPRALLSLFGTFLLGIAVLPAAETMDAFLEKHCLACHGPKKEKGDLRIDKLSRDFKLGGDTHHWGEVLEQINSGEMPPKKEKRPSQSEIAEFVTELNTRIQEGRAARQAARPAVAHYRLSRQEYQNTVYDLLGVRYDPTRPGELNEDTRWHGYERIGKTKIDSSGELPGGEKFDDVAGLKKILVRRKDLFAKMLADRLLTYACGRRIGALDEPTVEKIVAELPKHDYGLRSLIEAVVLSEAFRSL